MKKVLAYAALVSSLASTPALAGQELIILPEKEFSSYWRPAKTDVVHLDLSGRVGFKYGCVNVGFIVEADGEVSSPLRLLSYRFDQSLVSPSKNISFLFAQLGSFLPKFVPVREDWTPTATYTSRSIPVRNSKFSKALTPSQSEQLDQMLVNSCKISDLAERLTTGEKGAVQQGPIAEFDLSGPAQVD